MSCEVYFHISIDSSGSAPAEGHAQAEKSVDASAEQTNEAAKADTQEATDEVTTQATTPPTTQSPEVTSKPVPLWDEIIKQSRKYCIDLAPKVSVLELRSFEARSYALVSPQMCLSRGELVGLLVSSNVARYMCIINNPLFSFKSF
jgi:hypothetical protein